jgi:hypothetical protein
MVPVNHKCTISDIGLDLILQLFKGQCQKGHYCISVVEAKEVLRGSLKKIMRRTIQRHDDQFRSLLQKFIIYNWVMQSFFVQSQKMTIIFRHRILPILRGSLKNLWGMNNPGTWRSILQKFIIYNWQSYISVIG